MIWKQVRKNSYQVAKTILDISFNAHTGHIGSALSISDLVSVLYFSRLNINKGDWGNKGNTGKNDLRDRFILSKGHAAAALYSALYHKGIISKRELESFGMNDGGLCEHPEIFTPGVEMTSGSLGHGLAFGAGIAWGLKLVKNLEIKVQSSEKKRTSLFKLNNRKPHVFVLISDGECGEGSVWEAALFAGRMKLDNLTVILDYNGWQCFGEMETITHLQPLTAKWRAFGFTVREIDGHNLKQIYRVYREVPFESGKPSIIIAKTVSGHGVKSIENKLEGHFKVFSEAEYLEALRNIKYSYL